MAKYVICTIAHAGLSIGGIAFERFDRGVISVEPVEDAEAERLASIPGYELADAKPEAAKPASEPKTKLAKERKAANGDQPKDEPKSPETPAADAAAGDQTQTPPAEGDAAGAADAGQ